jgi:hypothetical protein
MPMLSAVPSFIIGVRVLESHLLAYGLVVAWQRSDAFLFFCMCCANVLLAPLPLGSWPPCVIHPSFVLPYQNPSSSGSVHHPKKVAVSKLPPGQIVGNILMICLCLLLMPMIQLFNLSNFLRRSCHHRVRPTSWKIPKSKTQERLQGITCGAAKAPHPLCCYSPKNFVLEYPPPWPVLCLPPSLVVRLCQEFLCFYYIFASPVCPPMRQRFLTCRVRICRVCVEGGQPSMMGRLPRTAATETLLLSCLLAWRWRLVNGAN